MNKDFRIYPCTKSGKLLKGFCITVCDCTGVLETLSAWKRFSSKFGIKYFAICPPMCDEFVVKPL